MQSASDNELLFRVLLGFGLSLVIGFERELRGSWAGDRTFALVGSSSATAAAVLVQISPNALAGILTGVGFLGGGLIIRGNNDIVRGVTTAATVFATAVVGVVVGLGHLRLGVVVAVLTVLVLELRFIPVLRELDPRRYMDRFRNDDDPPC